MQTFYNKLLAAINAPIFRDGKWKLCERSGWPDNQSCQNLVAWSWVKDDDRRLIAVNLSDNAVQARVRVPWEEVRGETWHLTDALSDASYDRDGNEMAASGLYVELQPWSYCFFQYQLAGPRLVFAPAISAASNTTTVECPCEGMSPTEKSSSEFVHL